MAVAGGRRPRLSSLLPPSPCWPSPRFRERYYDDVYEYRHVVLPQDIAKRLPKDKLLSEAEWRALGVQQSRGWGEWWACVCASVCVCSDCLSVWAGAVLAAAVATVLTTLSNFPLSPCCSGVRETSP